MRRIYRLFRFAFSAFAAFLVSCSSDVSLPVETTVPLEFSAGGTALLHTSATRADNLPESAFDATVVLSMKQGDYSLSALYESSHEVGVDTDGSVSWQLQSGSVQPVYPETGAWLYAVSVSPVAVPDNSGNVSYTLTGKEDLLYAPEIRGNKWEGDRFSGNGNSGRDKPLEFAHLLTRLQFKARKRQADGMSVKITAVKVNEALTEVTVPLSTGEPSFRGTAGLTLHPGNGGAGKDVPAGGTTVALGDLLLPPLSPEHNYTLNVETSIGAFDNIPIVFSDNAASGGKLLPGMSHEITFYISDTSLGVLSVTATPWELVNVDDDLELVP
ncbi:fimbrillin family protein [Bacteroides oleiciplenus]|uniref:Fimbrillin family protein n=1 Tax=Bacteroides oleiciplenus TaxID=626931 RepID=A0A3E5BS83_9BACE|nr:fimbrillin family protein [Bacteroides oleiciplenus]RGN40461.1 hypothetical protein DXB65_02215 [Bacteroides oleiciplenus]